MAKSLGDLCRQLVQFRNEVIIPHQQTCEETKTKDLPRLIAEFEQLAGGANLKELKDAIKSLAEAQEQLQHSQIRAALAEKELNDFVKRYV